MLLALSGMPSGIPDGLEGWLPYALPPTTLSLLESFQCPAQWTSGNETTSRLGAPITPEPLVLGGEVGWLILTPPKSQNAVAPQTLPTREMTLS